VPKIETVLIENNETAPQAGGEPAIILMGALIANAIHDATGARLFQLPPPLASHHQSPCRIMIR